MVNDPLKRYPFGISEISAILYEANGFRVWRYPQLGEGNSSQQRLLGNTYPCRRICRGGSFAAVICPTVSESLHTHVLTD